MVFRWREGSRIPVNAQVAGERVAALTEANGGYLAPADVVEDARPADSPLHPAFEWDDSVAAEKFREEQARMVIRSLRVVHMDAHGEERPVLGYVHVELPDVGPAYVDTARATSDAELNQQIIADAIAAFEALRRRYEHLQELAPLFQAIADTAREVERRTQRKAKRRSTRERARAGV